MTAPEPPAVRAALIMAKHSLDPDYRDADRNDACVCGGWVSGPMEPGWDDHLAEVLAEAGLLVPDTGRPTAPDHLTLAADRLVQAWRRGTWRIGPLGDELVEALADELVTERKTG